MENPADIAAIAAAIRDPANDATSQAVHTVPSAEPSQNQEGPARAVADAERWPDPVDPANPGGGIKPLMTTYAELQGGPHDGSRMAVVDDTDTIWVGPVAASWVIDSGLPPSSVVGGSLHGYAWQGHLKDDGTRIYQWIQPQGHGEISR